jgi:hypothetical protein
VLAARVAELRLGERFCGPPASANGGYACGAIAELLSGGAEVTLRRPPPLGRPLRVRVGGGDAVVHDGDELGVLGAVINERVRLLATARSMRTLASLRVGDRGRINHSAKPNYLHGRAATVSGWAGQNVVVQLDQPIGRFTTGELRCPPLVLEPLAAE